MKQLDREGLRGGVDPRQQEPGPARPGAIAAFREGEVRVLVATDVAARGIDIPGVGHVYNYELPNVPENYVHRIGRTARAGASGRAVAFCAPEEMADLRSIEKLLGEPVAVAGGRPWHEQRESARPARPQGRPQRRPAGRGRGARAARG